jgi:hypothetical protein
LIAKGFIFRTKRVNLLAKLIILVAQGVLLSLQLLASLERDTQLIGHVVPLGAQTFLLDFKYSEFAVGAIELRSEGLYSSIETYLMSVNSWILNELQQLTRLLNLPTVLSASIGVLRAVTSSQLLLSLRSRSQLDQLQLLLVHLLVLLFTLTLHVCNLLLQLLESSKDGLLFVGYRRTLDGNVRWSATAVWWGREA